MLFEESNWILLPPSPSLVILLLDCMPKSPNPTCNPLLDSIFENLIVLKNPNCVSKVGILEGFLTDGDSKSYEVEVDPGGVSTTLYLCRFLPIDPSLVKSIKELKSSKL